MEKALTLKDAAELLGVSYSTVYAHKEDLGFFKIGNQWRVWPEILRERSLEGRQEKVYPRIETGQAARRNRRPSGSRRSEQQSASKELDEILAQKPKVRLKKILPSK
jgi:excisionase family DNA binding protein